MTSPVTGRPSRARDRLRHNFIFALAEDFATNGVKAIELARLQDPLGYVKVCASLMPKEVELTRPLDDIPDEQLDAAVIAVRAIFAAQDTGNRAEGKSQSQSAEVLSTLSETS